MLMEKGFNIVTYDQRYHGASKGKLTSLGHLEQADLYDVITDTFKRFGSDIYLGTYGESMGAATVLLEAKNDDRVQFIFSDCGFKNLSDLMDEILQKHRYFPKFLFKPVSDLFFKVLTGSYYNGISPIIAIKSLNIPIFFAHGEADDFIAFHHTVDLYESYKGPKEIFIAGNDAKHARSYVRDTKKYEESISNFVRKYLPD